MAEQRIAKTRRDTAETKISMELNIDGTGRADVSTGIPFLDHMLVLFCKHGLFDLTVEAEGDIEVDYHHTVEDVGLVLGELFKKAIGDKMGIRRYGFFILPMDEALVRIALDFSNRPVLVYDVEVENYMIRDFNLILIKEFFRAFANAGRLNLHVKLEYGEEPHHIAEALFKCLAKALDVATQIDARTAGELPSTKGLLV
ncbi:MAG TPA: imidazoleglycerol-phosphate dehydratase HisB [Opitutales bacterium]|nr:imidazoleglycerol-phosphate dehydratase HisB [Opitutales bacterium]